MSYIYLEPQLYYMSQPFTGDTVITHDTFPVGGGVCSATMLDVSQVVRDHIVPLYESTRNTWQPAMPPLTGDIINGRPGSESYANLYPPDKPRPPDVQKALPELRIGGGLRKVDFEKAKREGRIILQKRLVAETRAVVTPGILRDDLRSPTQVILKRDRAGTFLRGYSSPCNYRGIICNDPVCVLVSSANAHAVERNPRVVYQRYRWDGDWKYPTDGLVEGMMEAVQHAAIAAPQDNGVVTAALAEANNKYWDVLTEIAELPELIRYIMDGLKEILNLSKTFKKARRDLLKSGGALSELSSLWLQYRYAIMPIVYSIEDAMEYLTAHSTIFVSTRKRSDSFITPPEIPGWTVSGEISVRQRCFLKRKFDLSVSDSVFLTVNPLLTGWEKVTLSFVIDWAVNIGDFLAALVPPAGIEEEKALYSNQVPKGTEVVYTSTRHYGMTVTISTGVYNAYPINPLANIGLKFDPEMNWMRELDAIALMWQLFLKRYFTR